MNKIKDCRFIIMDFLSVSATRKRSHTQAFPQTWVHDRQNQIDYLNPDLHRQEHTLESNVYDLERKWDKIHNESGKIYEDLGLVYDEIRQAIEQIPCNRSDEIPINMSFREGISMARQLQNTCEQLLSVATKGLESAKTHETRLMENYSEYLKTRDQWIKDITILAEVTDKGDSVVFEQCKIHKSSDG